MQKITPKMIESMIYMIRGRKVMLDSDLAELYEVETRIINRNVKRNIQRFPDDFMFQITKEEYESLISQFGISKAGRGGRRKMPFVFSENGVAMLSSVLNSEKAIQVNISIMRIFTKMRRILLSDDSLSEKIAKLESDSNEMKRVFRIVFEKINILESEIPILPKKRKRIGLKK
ncbi:MAG: ORF6N domain-containing protein [Epsilonproteobacteria bacterium]|nr:MAG: ORF6N domain-containing protein [Campylobacterota bacterium]